MFKSGPRSDVYVAYSLTLSVDAELSCDTAPAGSVPDVIIRETSDGSLTRSEPRVGVWFQHDSQSDGSDVLRWGDTYKCWVSPDGHSIRYKPLSDASAGAFAAYVLSSALSFSLLKLRREHLHATCVVVDGHAIGFLGQPGDGKSTLAASFLAEGDRLLTDDLLVLLDEGGDLMSYPGLPRIKLLPKAAKLVLGTVEGALRMNRTTPKLVLPVAKASFWPSPLPLRRLYILEEGPSISVEILDSQEAFLALTRNTYNAAVADTSRLEQHLAFVERVYAEAGVSILRFPREFGSLGEVRSAILRDLAG